MKVQFLRFLVTGGIAAFVNLSARYVLNFWIVFEIAVILAYILGMVTAYLLARRYVFDRSGRGVRSELGRFAIINVFSLLMVWITSVSLARVIFPAIGLQWHANDIAHLIGVAVPAALSFWGHRYYTFAVKSVVSKFD